MNLQTTLPAQSAKLGSRMRLGPKLFLSLLLLIAVTVGLIAFFLYNMTRIQAELTHFISNDLQRSDLSEEIVQHVLLIERDQKDMLLTPSGTERDKYASSIAEHKKNLANIIEQLQTMSEEEAIDRKLDELDSRLERFYALDLEIGKLMGEDPRAAIELSRGASEEAITAVHQAADDVLELGKENITEHQQEMIARYRNIYGISLTVAFAGIISSASIFFWVVAFNIRPQFAEATETLASASAEIGTTAEEQEKVLAQQAASVTETTTTMDELNASARRSAEQADATAESARTASQQTREGNEAVEQMLAGMRDLKEKVGAIGEQILRLSEQTGQISSVTLVVTDIASQTNLLALNAAVEAARAGEQGRGFAVVAQEIRKLADESKKSAEKISTLVGEVQKVTNATVMVAEEGAKKVEISAHSVEKSGDAFRALAAAIGSIAENAQQIALTARQQASAITQVVEAMNSISAGAKQAETGVAQTKTSLQQLAGLARDLRALV
jgi:hypothetical protein